MEKAMTRAMTTTIALLALIGINAIVSDAAPKVPMKIVPRPRPASEVEVGPVPYRPPMAAAGPRAHEADLMPCLKDNSVVVGETDSLLDVCLYKNVTFIPKATGAEGEEKPQRKILGMFRGWAVDPIMMQYKYMAFDDGDYCEGGYGARYSFAVELVPSKDENQLPVLYDIRQTSQCVYNARLYVYVSPEALSAADGLQSPGVVDFSPASDSLPRVCGEMKCNYDTIRESINDVRREVDAVKSIVMEALGQGSDDSASLGTMTMETASNIVKTSGNILERALSLLHTLEEAKKPNPELEVNEVKPPVVSIEAEAAGDLPQDQQETQDAAAAAAE